MGENDQADDRTRLLANARTILARGDNKFSIALLCAEAGVTRDVFRAHFGGKAALLAALMTPEPAEPVVAAPDAWLERRLRVFERALNALEARVDAGARDQSGVIAALEEKRSSLGSREANDASEPAPPAPEPPSESVAAVEPAVARQAMPLLPPLKQPCAPLLSRSEMADVLQAARGKTRFVPEEAAPRGHARLRWLAIGVLSLAALFLCAGLMLGDTARATAADLAGSGTTPRKLSPAGLARTIALADVGDARAQTALAVAYLRGATIGEDSAAAYRWSVSAARAVLTGIGNSPHAAASTANGTVIAVVPTGGMRHSLAQWTGVNALTALSLNLSGNNSNVPLRCAVASFTAKNGLLTSQRFLIDTDPVRIEGGGFINMRQETLNLRVQGKPKNFQLVRLRAPITVQGRWEAPVIGVDAGEIIAQGGIAAALGFLSPLAAIFAFIDPGLAEDANCRPLLAEAQAKGAPVKTSAIRNAPAPRN
jgi:AcrR family transcriptional regulator